MNCKAVIFDMDGTLLNTVEDLADSVNYVMNQYGFPTKTVDEVKHCVGSGAAVFIGRVIPDGKNNEKFNEILKSYKAYYLDHCNIKTGPYEHIIDLLAELKNRGYKIAIVSNKSMGAVKELSDLYFKDYVDVAIGVEEGLQRKPAPDECLAAIRELRVSKDDCIYVGDSEIDHLTAINTGIKCISCLWGFRTREELLAAGAEGNFFVEDPMEILDILK